uniref:Slc5a-3 n=1 Tax=Schmidtea mediterranea TaxID=79327 RepID=A0A0H3YK02_SCHMD|nr:slc5a-3 [Schmidtea mediterranea]
MSQTLGWVDYLVWILLLVISLGIGIYFGFFESKIKRRKQATEGETDEFLLGGRKMGAIPVACSLMASFFSAITLLGTPNEIYQYGVMYWFIGIGYVTTIIISALLFVPIFYNLGITSSYQYLGLRFSRTNQVLGAVGFILQMTPYMGIVLYGPAMALKVVVNVNIWIVVISMAVVCTIYTTVGGLKAVVWTDVFQLVMMFSGMLAIIIKGTVDSGGLNSIMKTASSHERLNLNFSPNPQTRHSFWSLVIGGTFLWCGIYAINQTMIQRAISIKSLKQAKLSYFLNLPGMNMLLMVVILCGFVIFNIFYGCDPLLSGKIKKSDELVPYYVSKYLLQYPGVGGIFVAGIFSGGLSTMSSGLNSLAAVTLNDIIMLKYTKITDKTASRVSKVLVVVYGVLTLFFAYISSLTSKILEAALGLFGMLSGPALGVFTLGIFFPFSNFKGAISGHLISQIMIFWIGFGMYIHEVKHPKLTLSDFNCTGMGNVTKPTETVITSNGAPLLGIQHLYAISYMWYSFIGWAIVLIVGIPISLITNSKQEDKVRSKFISPICKRIWSGYIIEDKPSNLTENPLKLEDEIEISSL